MARLEVFNERLAYLADSKCRLLYITGDNSLLSAGLRHKLPSGETFTDAYLRHPRAFLDEPGVVRPQEGEGHATAADVLLLCLGRFEDLANAVHPPVDGRVPLPDKFGEKTIEEKIAEVERSDPTAVTRTRKQWGRVADAAAKFVPPQPYLDQIKSELGNPQGFISAIDALRPQIEDAAGEAWDNYFEVIIGLRFVIEVWTGLPRPARLVPNLCFEARPEVTEFIQSFDNWLRDPRSFSMTRYRQLRDSLGRDEGDKHHKKPREKSRYYYFLAHAWLLASQGQWNSAAVLSSRAVEAVQSLPLTPSFGAANGREAKYFAAFCRRHTAERVSDLKGLDQLLSDAETIAKNEASPTLRSPWPLDIVIERFEAERKALELSSRFFEWMETLERGTPGAEQRVLKSIAQKTSDIWNFTKKIEENLEAQEEIASEFALLNLNSPPYQPNYNDRVIIRRQLLERAWRNLFGIGLMVPNGLPIARRAWTKLRIADGADGLNGKTSNFAK